MSLGQVTILIYAALMILGGLIGYYKGGSMISLVAGSASGVLLLAAFAVSRSRPAVGLWMGAVLALLLAGNFGQRWYATGKLMPPGALMFVSVIAMILLVVSALGARGK